MLQAIIYNLKNLNYNVIIKIYFRIGHHLFDLIKESVKDSLFFSI
jgi:hypothetical protein